MNGNKKSKGLRLYRPVYKTDFSVTEELYRDKSDTEPVFAYTMRGRFGVDVVRLLCLGGALVSAVALLRLAKK